MPHRQNDTSSAAIGAFYPDSLDPPSLRERTPKLLTSRMPLSWALSPEFQTDTRGAIMREVPTKRRSNT